MWSVVLLAAVLVTPLQPSPQNSSLPTSSQTATASEPTKKSSENSLLSKEIHNSIDPVYSKIKNPKLSLEAKWSNKTKKSSRVNPKNKDKDVIKNTSLPNPQSGQDTETQRIPPVESLIRKSVYINQHDGKYSKSEGTDKLSFKSRARKKHKDYEESRRAYQERQSRRMQDSNLHPALAALLPNSKHEDDELLKHQFSPKGGRRQGDADYFEEQPQVPVRIPQHLLERQRKYKRKSKKRKLGKLVKFIKENKGILHELIEEKHERGGGGAGPALRAGGGRGGKKRKGHRGEAVPRAEDIQGDQLDLIHARGSKIAEMRLKGRICDRSVLKLEGPKYNSRGKMYKHPYNQSLRTKFNTTKTPKMVLPICCNCCAKSALGCE